MDTALRELLAGSLARPSPIAGRLRAGRLHQKRDAECCLRQQFPHTETKTYRRNASILRGFKRTSHFGRWRGLAAAAGFETPHQYRPARSLAGSTVNRLCATLRANSLDCEGSPGECWIPVPLPPASARRCPLAGLSRRSRHHLSITCHMRIRPRCFPRSRARSDAANQRSKPALTN
jgi:hypothetical protein